MKKKKIILYHPATNHEKFYLFFWVPYSLLTIASMVSDEYDVILIDSNIKEDISIDKETLDECLCIGISMMTGNQISGAIKFAKKVKTYDKKIPIIVGGTHPTLFPQLTINNPYFDFLIQGQGEFPFFKLVNYLNSKSIFLKDIEGLVYIENNRIIINEENSLLSKKNFPNYPWELIKLNQYINNDPKVGTKTINYISSQGCPFQCKFCSETGLYKNRWETYGSDRIIKDVDYLINKININAIKFYDANFFVNLKVIDNFMSHMISNHQKIKWAASGHPKTLYNLSDSFWRKLQKSKCTRLLIGAESGSQRVLDYIKKDIKVEQILSLAYKLKEFDIIGSFTFIVGFPGIDIEEEIEKTLLVATKIRNINILNDVKIHFFSPYPGTVLYSESIKYGFIPPMTLDGWAKYDYYNIETPWIDKKYEKIIHEFNQKNCDYVNL